MARYPAGNISYSFGPGPATPAVRALIWANVAVFLADILIRRATSFELTNLFGLRPIAVVEGLQIWQIVTYLFLHGGVFHVLFNMLALWMFGTELERMWGARFFARYYFVTGIGAGIATIGMCFTPFGREAYLIPTIGASGAIYGVLLAYGLYFPNRTLYLILFPIPAKYFVMIAGAIAFLAATDGSGSGVAHTAHLGGLVVGYLYLKGGGMRLHPMAEVKYRYLKWRINRMRRKFDVLSGGRADDVNRRVH